MACDSSHEYNRSGGGDVRNWQMQLPTFVLILTQCTAAAEDLLRCSSWIDNEAAVDNHANYADHCCKTPAMMHRSNVCRPMCGCDALCGEGRS